MGVFLFRNLSIDIRHFRVFVFCHRAYSKTRKPQKISRSSIFDVLRLIMLRLCVKANQGIAQSYQGTLTIEA